MTAEVERLEHPSQVESQLSYLHCHHLPHWRLAPAEAAPPLRDLPSHARCRSRIAVRQADQVQEQLRQKGPRSRLPDDGPNLAAQGAERQLRFLDQHFPAAVRQYLLLRVEEQ